jgi:hypothetical protein
MKWTERDLTARLSAGPREYIVSASLPTEHGDGNVSYSPRWSSKRNPRNFENLGGHYRTLAEAKERCEQHAAGRQHIGSPP